MKKLIKKILFTLVLVSTLVPSFAFAASSPLSRAKLNIDLDQPAKAYPDGNDCISAHFEALTKDGFFLKNEPIIITRPQSVKIMNGKSEITTTQSGSEDWCITSTSSIKSQVTIKLANYPTVRKSFNVNFKTSFNIKDETDRSLFRYKAPIEFTAKIDPILVRGIKTAQLKYVYQRRYNSWGFWFSRRETVTLNLNCDSEGYCTTTLNGDHTKYEKNKNGHFIYTFLFIDKNGISFNKNNQGKLK